LLSIGTTALKQAIAAENCRTVAQLASCATRCHTQRQNVSRYSKQLSSAKSLADKPNCPDNKTALRRFSRVPVLATTRSTDIVDDLAEVNRGLAEHSHAT